MHTLISIDCEGPEELLMHLAVITKSVKAAFKANPEARGYITHDNNCYGTHAVHVFLDAPEPDPVPFEPRYVPGNFSSDFVNITNKPDRDGFSLDGRPM